MHILVPVYQFPDDLEPTSNAVAHASYIGADVWDFSSGRISVRVSRSLAHANAVPAVRPGDSFEVPPGTMLTEATEGNPEVRMPTVLEIDASAHALRVDHPDLTPMQLLGLVIYMHLLGHPRLPGATLVAE